MEDLKSKLKMTITLELQGLISLIKQKKGSINKNQILELASYIGANFLSIALKEEGQMTKRELDAVYGNINDFFLHNYHNEINPDDLQKMMINSVGILQGSNPKNDIDSYFKSITSE
jgi:hypothetical protein